MIVLSIVTVLLPLIALLSGMALSLVLAVIVAATLVATRPLAAPSSLLPDHRRAVAALGLFFLFPLLGCAWSIAPGDSTRAVGTGILISGLSYASFLYAGALPAPSRRTVLGTLAMTGIVGLLLIQEQLGGGLLKWFYDATHQSYDRFIGKNVNRGLCAFSVLIWALMYGAKTAGRARWGWASLGLLFVGVVLMHSLSAKLGMVAGLLTYGFLRPWPVLGARLVALLPLCLLLIPALLFASGSHVVDEAWLTRHLPSSETRVVIWRALMEQVELRPWLGWGADTTRALPLSPETLNALGLASPPLHPHNTALEMLIEQGVLGLVAMVAALLALLRLWMRAPLSREARATSGALVVAYLAAGISSFGLWQSWWISTLWVASALWRWFGRADAHA